MKSNLERFRNDLSELLKRGDILRAALKVTLYFNNREGTREDYTTEEIENFKTLLPAGFELSNIQSLDEAMFRENYQSWFTEALEVIRQILPERKCDFEQFYKKENRKSITLESYCIADFLLGISMVNNLTQIPSFEPLDVALSKFTQQYLILKSVEKRFESTLFDIRQLVQADLFDSEIEAAKELHKKGFLRAAGAVSGVILEKHLRQVCSNHGIKVTIKRPVLNDFIQALKDNNIIETPDWRYIQRLADLRNLCDHNKHREPTKEEVEDLVRGVDKVMKSIS